jgi:hypothetical protein
MCLGSVTAEASGYLRCRTGRTRRSYPAFTSRHARGLTLEDRTARGDARGGAV